MGPAIKISNLQLIYGPNTILTNIEHTFAAGKCHVLMGPNGGGKTSLLRSVLGLTPFDGSIELHWGDTEPAIGYVPQKANFEASLPLTVMDFILLNQTRHPLFWRQNRKQKQRAMAQLARVGMAERHDRRMGQLSGGEQQRVLFAQALLDDPQLLVLDEPTTGMDEQGVRYIESLLHDLTAKGVTILAVHHDVKAVERMADPEVHIVNRRIVHSGPRDKVLTPENIVNMFQHYTESAA
ncbi:metal ABC transporter ATP-binding protein [Vibrio methylphosphonaticus]|uniref:metal ABC transporter ATP-binding protein n=1 Tax=Vibrio methylphosphonaticus TaxID=2946866 RepID=UPI00202A9746|nr:metal ABC transporter ATP-binding protein [Vibrio methylphosphonaticus]MCL9776258.1 metal ABC transporter ATP-binding protein [Vibrio methylphosphonaticus]